MPVKKATPASASNEPELFNSLTHALDVAGLVPVIGEVADGANSLFYLTEGNKVDAAPSTIAMMQMPSDLR